MEKTGTETTPSRGLYGAIGGAGGKMRKPPSRKPQTTPYSRPPPAEKRRWLSSIVDPAYRLISGGATRLFPSLFSPESSVAALPSPEVVVQFHDASGDEHNLDNVEAEEHNVGGDESNLDSNNGVARITGTASTSRAQNSSKHGSHFDGHEADKSNDLSDITGLSEIEQLLKGKKFSRDEANRLMEIIQSKAVQLPTVDHDRGKQSLTAGGEAKEPAITHDVTKTPTENHKDMSKATWGTSTPLPQSAMRDEVGASPVNIARAYMGSRKLDVDTSSSKITISEDERKMLNNENFASTPFIPASTSKKSTCWPGSMAKDQRDYSERGRVGLHNFPRTPYSRTIFSTSKSKRFTPLQGGKDKSPSTPSTHLKQLQTPVYGEAQPRSDALDGGYGSAGPIRRTRHKFATQTPTRGSPYVYSAQIGKFQVDNSKFTKEYLPSEKKNFELGGLSGKSIDRKPSSFQVGVHPQSSQIARSILEHIDRNSPTPKDKSEELKLAIGWKKPISSDSPTLNQNGDDSSLIGGFSSRKVINHDYQKKPALESVDKWRSLFKVPPPKNTLKATEVTSNGIAGDESYGRSLVKSTNEDFPKTALNVVGSDVSTQPQMKPAFEPSGTKRFFPSISIDKPESKWVLPSDKSSAFTFPVSTSPAAFSEPPTPSIMPSFSTSNEHQPKDGDSVPTFNFGSKKSDRLAFTFPYTSDAAQNDTSDIKFSFGSDKPRLSFKDAVCC